MKKILVTVMTSKGKVDANAAMEIGDRILLFNPGDKEKTKPPIAFRFVGLNKDGDALVDIQTNPTPHEP